MQRNEVINFGDYHGEEDASRENDDGGIEELPAGTKLLHGQYKITAYLNSGGFGITYRATDSLGRDVVIKECFPGVMCFRADKEVRVRSKDYANEYATMVRDFVQEAHALAAMDHNNIVKVHQVFEENNSAYMAIDYIDGLDLMAIAEEQPDRLGPHEIERLTRQMLRAIRYVHDHGVLHRDISPDNILLDCDDEPILIDFGAAREKAKKSGHAMSRLKFVKDGYSPQEFYVEGTEQGPWSDLYSFAASIYHLISGEAPVEGQVRLAALAKDDPDPYIPLFGNRKGYTRGFLKAIDKTLQVSPEERFQTADEWLEALSMRTERRRSRTRSQIRTSTSRLPPPSPPRKPSQGSSTQEHRSAFKGKPDSDATGSNTPSLAPLVLQRSSQLTSHEQDVRDSMKGDALSERPSKAPLLIAASCAALVSAFGSVGLFVLGGGTENSGTPTAIEPVALPTPALPPDEPTDAIETVLAPQAPKATASPGEAGFKPLTFEEIMAGGATSGATTLPDETASPKKLQLAALAPLPAFDELDPRSASVVPNFLSAALLPQNESAATASSTDQSVFIPDNDTQFADLALAMNEPTEIPGLPKVEPARLVSNIAPSVFFASVGATFSSAPTGEFAPSITATTQAALRTRVPFDGLPDLQSGTAPVIQTAAPAPLPKAVPQAAQVLFSHWNVEMPFTSDMQRVRNAITARITSVSPTADLSVSGEWIADGVTIYAFNGETLIPDTAFETHVLSSATMDPDGFARATVRYQPDGGTIDRGLLAVPVIREIGLADGTQLTARIIDREWNITVTAFGDNTETSLRLGDQLLQEIQTGIDFASHEDIDRALNTLAAQGTSTAEFTVNRGGTEIKASYELVKEGR